MDSPLITLILLGFATVSGDFYSNDAPIKAQVPAHPAHSKVMAGSLWQVVTPRLNCRRQAATQATIVRQFRRGDILEAEVGRGGADEVLRNVLDTNGKPWMWVRYRTTRPEDACFVRAHRRLIQPLAGQVRGKPADGRN
ncbi:hypothetical protein GlitD10_1867 [Gloeomargarita lithophora Alchichica-D10]|uniref:Uncharacterized protein n=1 Tax=Gloeomargarita lithophora Alchichica-D10 TaxID=1188229 RepID=A0A1J0AE35_9CYAN|nr:hypothetical protein [Gloeomargarita lithophora]APB34193.1 hypothetical protein GlitD10_1867 [Gloeomargarita lithophora Alchichica-D10]